MLLFLKNFIIFVCSLCFLVVVHEFGHYITAKMFKVYVTEFSVGFGPAIYSKRKEGKETKYSLRAIPLGGYCAMVGEELPEFTEEEFNNLSEKDQEIVTLYRTVDKSRRLDGIAKYKKAIIMAAGVILNFILGYILCICSAFTLKVGVEETLYYANQVQVVDNSIASSAGWKNDDIIHTTHYVVTLNDSNQRYEDTADSSTDTSVFYYTIVKALDTYTPTNANDNIHFELTTSEAKKIDFILPAVENSQSTTGYSWSKIGISFYAGYGETRKLNFKEGMEFASVNFKEASIAIFKGVGQLFTKEGINQAGSIVAIFVQSGEINSQGLGHYFFLWAVISINLGIMNLLPFPGLDGWHLLVVCVEAIIRRELPKKFKHIMQTIGMVLLFGLMIVLVFKDVFTFLI